MSGPVVLIGEALMVLNGPANRPVDHGAPAAKRLSPALR